MADGIAVVVLTEVLIYIRADKDRPVYFHTR